jgi:hypothetical protein
MKKLSVAVVAALLLAASLAVAETAPKVAKNYQATGPVLELTDTMIVIDKGKEGRWEIARNKDTKVSGGELKVGEKVTIMYQMTAASIEVKAEKATAPKVETKKK